MPSAPEYAPDNASRDPAVFRRWLRKVEVWRLRIRSYKPLSEAALDLHEAIKGDAFREVEFMSLDDINQDEGCDPHTSRETSTARPRT